VASEFGIQHQSGIQVWHPTSELHPSLASAIRVDAMHVGMSKQAHTLSTLTDVVSRSGDNDNCLMSAHQNLSYMGALPFETDARFQNRQGSMPQDVSPRAQVDLSTVTPFQHAREYYTAQTTKRLYILVRSSCPAPSPASESSLFPKTTKCAVLTT